MSTRSGRYHLNRITGYDLVGQFSHFEGIAVATAK
jgi:hypothetical protein